MSELKYASVRYCPQLGRNVIMEGKFTGKGDLHWECLNKEDCDYKLEGCRNRLIPKSKETVQSLSAEVG